MKLESARALKQELATTFSVQPRVSPDIAAAAVGISSVAFATLSILPTWALTAVATAGAARLITRPAPEPGVFGMGICGNKGNYSIAVRVYNASPGMENVMEQIRRKCKGEIHERYIGRVLKQTPWYQSKNRPLRIGGSVGRTDEVAAGTLGCFSSLPTGSANDLILSNNHVLAQENDGKKGDRIVQPGRLDGGKASNDFVAKLIKFKTLKKRHNLVDAAVAELESDVEYYYNWLEGIGPLKGVRTTPLEDGEIVYKVGRTTGKTKGRVSATEMDSVIVGGYSQGDLGFDEQIEIEPIGSKPFSLAGDSGSLIVDSRCKAVGLLFAGNDVDATYANTIDNVLDALKINLVY